MSALFTTEQLKLMQSLGSASGYKLDSYSLSSVKSKFTHVKHLLKAVDNNINDPRLLNNANALIDTLKDKHGKLLINSYKRQIAYTLKQILPQTDVQPEVYKYADKTTTDTTTTGSNTTTPTLSAHNINGYQNYNTNQLTPAHLTFLRQMLIKACAFITNRETLYYTPTGQVPFDSYDFIDVYDTMLCIVLTSTTLLRISFLMQLKMSHLDAILAEQPIAIPAKWSHNGRTSKLHTIVKNDFLVKLIEIIRGNRPRIIAILSELLSLGVKHLTSKQERAEKNFILLSSQATMRRKLKRVSVTVQTDQQQQPVYWKTLGYNLFRKLTTSILVDQGGLDVAQLMNSHVSSKTTLDHYTIQNTKALNTTFNALANNK